MVLSYSPLGRGFLSGEIRSPEDLAPDDFRRSNPRFSGDNFAKNLTLVDSVKAMAAQKNITPAQLALAWILAQGDDIIPIPGTKRTKYLEQNAAAVDIELTSEELARIEEAFPREGVAGERYSDMRFVNR